MGDTPPQQRSSGWTVPGGSFAFSRGHATLGGVTRLHHEEGPPLDEEIAGWAAGDDTSMGSLLDLFGSRSFAVLLVILLAPSALPVPTGGVTHILEIAAMLIALQLTIGMREIWLPKKWRAHQVNTQGKFLRALIGFVRRVDRVAKPRMSYLFGSRFSHIVFGAVVIVGVLGAFVAPPFSGLDTLPSLGVVLVSLSMLFRDVIIAAVGIVVLTAGIVLEVVLGRAALGALQSMWPF
jgi:hypothetical protein